MTKTEDPIDFLEWAAGALKGPSGKEPSAVEAIAQGLRRIAAQMDTDNNRIREHVWAWVEEFHSPTAWCSLVFTPAGERPTREGSWVRAPWLDGGGE